jgi:hypothetical protein
MFDLSLIRRILFIAVALVVCGDSKLVEAGVWNTVKEWYASFQLGKVDEASIPQTPVDYAGENGISTTRISGFMECASGPDSTRFRL